MATEPSTLTACYFDLKWIRIIDKRKQESDIAALRFRLVVHRDRPDLQQYRPEETWDGDLAGDLPDSNLGHFGSL